MSAAAGGVGAGGVPNRCRRCGQGGMEGPHRACEKTWKGSRRRPGEPSDHHAGWSLSGRGREGGKDRRKGGRRERLKGGKREEGGRYRRNKGRREEGGREARGGEGGREGTNEGEGKGRKGGKEEGRKGGSIADLSKVIVESLSQSHQRRPASWDRPLGIHACSVIGWEQPAGSMVLVQKWNDF